VAASHHGDTPYSGRPVTPVPVTPYTTSVDVNPAQATGTRPRAQATADGSRDNAVEPAGQAV